MALGTGIADEADSRSLLGNDQRPAGRRQLLNLPLRSFGFQLLQHRCTSVFQLFRCLGKQEQAFRNPVETIGTCGLRPMLLEHDMEVCASEPEGAHCRASWKAFVGVDPGTRLRIHIKRRVLQVELGIRLVHVDGGRQDLVVERHGRLDQTGNSGRSLGVAYLGFDASQRNALRLWVVLAEHGLQGLHLGRISGLCPGAMCLDQPDRRGRDAGVFVSSLERLFLPSRSRVVNAREPAVTRAADSPYHRIDPVLVALGILQTLESQHADAFSDHHSIRIDVER